jgi:hypothetical protein
MWGPHLTTVPGSGPPSQVPRLRHDLLAKLQCGGSFAHGCYCPKLSRPGCPRSQLGLLSNMKSSNGHATLRDGNTSATLQKSHMRVASSRNWVQGRPIALNWFEDGYCRHAVGSARTRKWSARRTDVCHGAQLTGSNPQAIETRAGTIYGFMGSFVPLAFTAVCVRLYSRRRFAKIGADDVVVVIGFVRDIVPSTAMIWLNDGRSCTLVL